MKELNVEKEIIKLIREIEEIKKKLVKARADVNIYDAPIFKEPFIYNLHALELSLVVKKRLLKLLTE